MGGAVACVREGGAGASSAVICFVASPLFAGVVCHPVRKVGIVAHVDDILCCGESGKLRVLGFRRGTRLRATS